MKKIIALVLTLVMVASLATFVSFAEDTPVETTVSPAFDHLENFSGKTYFIVYLKVAGKTAASDPANVAIYNIIKNKEGTLRVKITNDLGETYCIEEYFFDNIGTELDTGYGFLRLAICDYGIPVSPERDYTIYIDIVIDGKVAYYGESAEDAFDGQKQEGFRNNGAIVPDEAPHSYVRELQNTVVVPPIDPEIKVAPVHGQIENWSGKTWFITQVDSSNNEKLYGSLKNGKWTADIIIKDETTGEARIIKGYAFDDAGNEIYGTSFFRFAVCEYGIVPELGHTYTMTMNVYKGKELIASGTSATGEFASFNAAFTSDGPIIPEVPSHSSEVYDPTVVPTPQPPVTADASVYMAVVAVVALVGMAVVVTKKVHA